MELIKTKTILTKSKGSEYWFGYDYNMNLYRGCNHGCIYCDSRSNCYRIDNFDVVRGKEDALNILEKELFSKRKKGIVGIGSMSDTYNHLEEKYEFTRSSLKLLDKYNFGVSIDTKSNLILRDIDLLKKINKKSNVIIKITITTFDDILSKKIEPNASTSSERFKVVKKLSDEGIFVGILLNPVLPFITDTEENIKEMVRLAHINGAKFIYTYMSVTLRENQRDYYYERIDKLFNNLSLKYKKIYGDRYNCESPNSKRLYDLFKNECKRYGILYKMEDIIKTYKSEIKDIEQLSLF